jgi:hypothetical protein
VGFSRFNKFSVRKLQVFSTFWGAHRNLGRSPTCSRRDWIGPPAALLLQRGFKVFSISLLSFGQWSRRLVVRLEGHGIRVYMFHAHHNICKYTMVSKLYTKGQYQVAITCGVQINKEWCIPQIPETPCLKKLRHWRCSWCSCTCEFILIRRHQSGVRKQVAIIIGGVSNITNYKCIPQSQESYGFQQDPTH